MRKVSAVFRSGGVGHVAYLTRLRLEKEIENDYRRRLRPGLGFLLKTVVPDARNARRTDIARGGCAAETRLRGDGCGMGRATPSGGLPARRYPRGLGRPAVGARRMGAKSAGEPPIGLTVASDNVPSFSSRNQEASCR